MALLRQPNAFPTPPLGEVHNTAPISRKERKAQMFREDLEKMRLRNRKESYYHYEENGIQQPPDSLGYIKDADRFVTDVAGMFKDERDKEIEKREQMQYQKRIDKVDKEERRWGTIELQHQIEQKKLEDQRANYQSLSSNTRSMPYNPISLRYDDGQAGEQLRYSDESLRYRCALRAERLQSKSTTCGYNPVTNEPIERVHVPNVPKAPAWAQDLDGDGQISAHEFRQAMNMKREMKLL